MVEFQDSKDTCDVNPQSQLMVDIIMMQFLAKTRTPQNPSLHQVPDKTNERSEVAGKMKPYAILDVEQCYQLWQHTGIFWRDLKISM